MVIVAEVQVLASLVAMFPVLEETLCSCVLVEVVDDLFGGQSCLPGRAPEGPFPAPLLLSLVALAPADSHFRSLSAIKARPILLCEG